MRRSRWVERVAIVAVALATMATSRRKVQYKVGVAIPDATKATRVVFTASEEPYMNTSRGTVRVTRLTGGKYEAFVPANTQVDNLVIDVPCNGSMFCSSECTVPDTVKIAIESTTTVASWRREVTSAPMRTHLEPGKMAPEYLIEYTGNPANVVVTTKFISPAPAGVSLDAFAGMVNVSLATASTAPIDFEWSFTATTEGPCPTGVTSCQPPPDAMFEIKSFYRYIDEPPTK